MNYNTHTLANGLRIIHLPSAQPVVYCGYAVGAGTRDEELGREEGMAHFCEHITFKGTERRSSMQILGHLESVGGDLNAFTNKEETVYHAAVLKENIDRAVDLLTDIVFHSTYPQAEIDKEVEVIVDEIESYNDSPAELVYDLFENAVFGGHPLGHNILGTAEKLRRYTTADALRFTRRYYRPENSVFFAYGDVDFRKLVRLLERANAADAAAESVAAVSLPPQQSAISDNSCCGGGKDTAAALLPPYVAQHIEHHMDTHLAHVMLGTRAYDVHDERRIALYLLNNILGGPGMTARLNVSLRERNALVYTVESMAQSYSDTGLWAVYFGCDPKNVKRCLRLIRRELDKVMQRPLSDAQLRAAKRQIRGQIGIACDSRESFALDFAKSYLHYGWRKDVTALCERIDALTAADLQRVAQDLFAEERLTMLVIK
ncbi:MAG: pitrilysin family protein [Prevotella sp.]|uniref:M16 family metallopeptidase n=1 Tax=Leyella stercorea TaxID=363265 RepID=UPI002801D108|nr:pitrilysin family protein [Leyella stercorea]MDY4088686.1 pitrilysin family protein [Prevotella sp.]